MTALPSHLETTGQLGRIQCPVLVTERLVLRPPVEDDIPDLVRLANNRDVAKMTSRMPHPYTEEDARTFIGKIGSADFDACAYAITLAENGEYMGGAGMYDDQSGQPEIGYWLGEPYWGKGYATEAALALVDLAFRVSGIKVLHSGCQTINPASRKVLVKNGFKHTHNETGHSVVAGDVELYRFQLKREDWIAMRRESG